jgi:hypothetical protein
MKKTSGLVALVVVSLFLWNQYRQSAHQVATTSIGPIATTSKVGSSFLYPDPQFTPGDVLTTDTSAVCKSGYSSSVRNVPVSEKRQVYQEYGISYPEPQGTYEVDHFISLELGGSNDIKNLWPEPADPKPGFHEKDAVENYLHEQVCNGTMPLTEAQKEISTDWYAVYLRIQ